MPRKPTINSDDQLQGRADRDRAARGGSRSGNRPNGMALSHDRWIRGAAPDAALARPGGPAGDRPARADHHSGGDARAAPERIAARPDGAGRLRAADRPAVSDDPPSPGAA